MNPVPTSGSTSKQKSHRPSSSESSVGCIDVGLSCSNSSSIAKFCSLVYSLAFVDSIVFSSFLRASISCADSLLSKVDGRFDAAIMISSLVSRTWLSHSPIASFTMAFDTAFTLTGASNTTPSMSGNTSAIHCIGYSPNTASTISPRKDGILGGFRPNLVPP